MSVKATNWAWETDLPSHLKLVLLALAHCHNGKSNQCNPRVEVIAKMVGREKRAVQQSLKELETGGYIRRKPRRKGPRQASNQYELAMEGVVFLSAVNCSLKGSKRRGPGGDARGIESATHGVAQLPPFEAFISTKTTRRKFKQKWHEIN